MQITVEYELDPWDWQGVSQAIDIDSEDFDGMSNDQSKNAVYERICEDGQSRMHFVYKETEVMHEIREALANEQVP